MGESGRAADGETGAWVVALPIALLAVPLIALLAKPVGTLLYPQVNAADVFPWAQRHIRPEPRELGLYLLSLALPVVLVVAMLVAAARAAAAGPRVALGLSRVARAALGLLLLVCLVAQYRLRYEPIQGPPQFRFFAPPALIAGAVIALAVATAARSSAVRQRVERALRESDRRRIGALVLAGSITAVWMLHAIQTDSSIAWAPGGVTANVAYTSTTSR